MRLTTAEKEAIDIASEFTREGVRTLYIIPNIGYSSAERYVNLVISNDETFGKDASIIRQTIEYKTNYRMFVRKLREYFEVKIFDEKRLEFLTDISVS